jgi:hypothetical protein
VRPAGLTVLASLVPLAASTSVVPPSPLAASTSVVPPSPLAASTSVVPPTSLTKVASLARFAVGELSSTSMAVAPGPPVVASDAPPPPTSAIVSSAPEIPRSAVLIGRLHNPMPTGLVGGWHGDTGLDILGSPRAVFAVAAGTLDYSEPGHTWCKGPRDTPASIRIELDEPIVFAGKRVTHLWYTHLSALEHVQHEGEPRMHVAAGERIGASGVGNGVPHLHLGFLLDGHVDQESKEFVLRDDEIRRLFRVRYLSVLPR